MLAPVLQMFPSAAALRGSSARLKLKELLQSCHQGREGWGSHWSPPYQRLPIHGSFPGSTSNHSAPTGTTLWTHDWCHQSPIFRHQQTSCSITSGPLWWVMISDNHEIPKSPARKALIMREIVLLRLGELQSASPGGLNAAVASSLPWLLWWTWTKGNLGLPLDNMSRTKRE